MVDIKHLDNTFKKLAKVEFGLEFNTLNEHLLFNAIDSRIKQTGATGRESYLLQLTDNRVELSELICLLTNNETYFFREASQIKFLTDFLLPKIMAENSTNEPLRILSLGCSTGAEPYSIAMALQQQFGAEAAARAYTILGADVDNKALEQARDASYYSMAFRGVSIELQRRFFIEEKNIDASLLSKLVLKAEIRDRVTFYQTNIISECIPPEITDIDVIFFRNVSIYFDKATRFLIQKKIISMLKPNGYLLVGLTESMSNDLGLLTLKQQGDIFYFAKGEKAKQTEVAKNSQLDKRKTAKQIVVKETRPISLVKIPRQKPRVVSQIENKQDIKSLVQNKQYEAAIPLLEKLAADHSETIEHLLLHAFILFNRQEFDKASVFTYKALDKDALSVDAFLLLGMIAKWQEQLDDAIRWF